MYVHVITSHPIPIVIKISLRALYVGSTSKCSSEQRHCNYISTLFHHQMPAGILLNTKSFKLRWCDVDLPSVRPSNNKTHVVMTYKEQSIVSTVKS